jgi:hypothetical protein
MSLTQTIFYVSYIFFLRNYSNNAFNLRIADSVVYIQDSHGRHYNFKSGAGPFFACLIHNHPITLFIDEMLYRTCQTQIKKFMSLKCQLAVEMIIYGEECLGEKMFFERINTVYEQENLQPTKLAFEDTEEEDEKKEK